MKVSRIVRKVLLWGENAYFGKLAEAARTA